MASSQVWDVNKYKSEFESEEHWQLRKRFMETHMDKFPEDKLVCLARVFFNVEFLGCRYPEKTMRMIAELSKGVADEHREKQKGKLKRTFVQASDAAGSKIKGSSTQDVVPPKKIHKTNEGGVDYCSAHIKFTKPLSYPPDSEEFPGLIIFENCNIDGQVETCPFNILSQSVQKSGYNMKIVTNGRMCEIKINDKLLVSDQAPTAKEAKLNAVTKGLRKLRKTCYTIQVKRAYYSCGPSITKDSNAAETEIRLPQDNIGSKMMLKMGWSGSGLGKSQQGIEDPIKAAPQIMNRSGFGCVNQKDLENKFTKVFKDHIRSDSESDLVFSPDFTSDERRILHRNLSLPAIGDDNDSDDLFGSDSEKDCEVDTPVEHTSNSQLSQESSCFICSKLIFVTGEETDDDIYDLVWNTGYETNDLMLSNDHSEIEFDSTEPFSPKTKEDLTSESNGNNERLDVLFEQTEPAPSENVHTSSEKIEEHPLERLKIFLPDGSYKRIFFNEMLANKELREFTKYSDEKSNVSYRHFATIQDLKTNSALRELFSDFLLFHKPLADQCKTPEKLNEMSVLNLMNADHKHDAGSSQASNNDITLEDVSDTLQGGIQTTHSNFSLLSSSLGAQCKPLDTHNETSVVTEMSTTLKYEGGIFQNFMNTDITFKNISATHQGEIKHLDFSLLSNRSPGACSKTVEKHNEISVEKGMSSMANYEGASFQTYRTTDIANTVKPSNGGMKRKANIKIFLPNGSFKRIPVYVIERSEELTQIFHSSKVLTYRHFINHKIIRETFSEYWATQNQKVNWISTETSLTGWGGNNPLATTSTKIAAEESKGRTQAKSEDP